MVVSWELVAVICGVGWDGLRAVDVVHVGTNAYFVVFVLLRVEVVVGVLSISHLSVFRARRESGRYLKVDERVRLVLDEGIIVPRVVATRSALCPLVSFRLHIAVSQIVSFDQDVVQA